MNETKPAETWDGMYEAYMEARAQRDALLAALERIEVEAHNAVVYSIGENLAMYEVIEQEARAAIGQVEAPS